MSSTARMFEDTEDCITEIQSRVRNVKRKINDERHKRDDFIEQHSKAMKKLHYDLHFYKGLLEQFGAPEVHEDTFYSPAAEQYKGNEVNLKEEDDDSPPYGAIQRSNYEMIGRDVAAARNITETSVATGRTSTLQETTTTSVTSTIAGNNYDIESNADSNAPGFVVLQETNTPRRSTRLSTTPPSRSKREEIEEERAKARAWFLDRQNSKKKKGI
jgi:hypothetical protein